MMKKQILFILSIFVSAQLLFAQPVITSFSPVSGPTGIAGSTNIIINGSNFAGYASQNKVFFGAVAALPTSGSITSLTVTVPAGASFQNLQVLNTITGLSGYAYENPPFIPTFASGGCTFNSSSLQPPISFSSGGIQDWVMAVGDIDGDGKPDLVVTNWANNSISIFLNTSNTGYINNSSFAAHQDFTTGGLNSPYGVTIGDLDGDGKLDIIVANAGNNTLSVFKNNSTAGSISLSAQATISVPSQPGLIAIGDLDIDGKPDIVVGNNGNAVCLYKNNSTIGTIVLNSVGSIITGTGTPYPNSVVIADIDGDGRPDIVAGNYTNNNLSIIRHISSTGSLSAGLFESPFNFSTGNGPLDVKIADIDGDGKPDIVVNNNGDKTISVFRNTSVSGAAININSLNNNPTINLPYLITIGSATYIMSMGDIDGDGKPDIAVPRAGGINVYRNLSVSGTISLSTASSFYATGADDCYIGDLNGDGRADLVSVNYSGTVSVFGNFSIPTISNFSPANGATGLEGTTSVMIAGCGFNSTTANNTVYFGGVKAIPSAGTATSLTVTAPTGANFQNLQVLNTITGLSGYAYENPPFIPTFASGGCTFNSSSLQPPVSFTGVGGSNPLFMAIGDLDGDGKPEIVLSNNVVSSISVFLNTSSTGLFNSSSFAAPVNFSAGSVPYGVAIADLDGDGKLDIAVVNYSGGTISIFKNTSTGIGNISFQAQVTFSIGTNPRQLAIGDLDGDGKPDIVVGYSGATTVSVLKNTSTIGSITSSSFATGVTFTVGNSQYGVAIGDIDKDGWPDIVTCNYSTNNISILRNNGIYGSITSSSFATAVNFNVGTGPRDVKIADIDGDGKPDIVVNNGVDNTISIFRNTASSGVINSGSLATAVVYTTGYLPYAIAIGDIDGDGKPDIATGNNGISGNNISLFRNISTIGNISLIMINISPNVAMLSPYIGDLNGDGRTDLAALNTWANSVSVFGNFLIPAISSFSPVNGATGTAGTTSVVINGCGFNTTAANNAVYFGGVKAIPSTGTATSLTVTAPAGATYFNLQVLNTTTGLSSFGYEQAPFLPTLPVHGCSFGTNILMPTVNYNAGNTPQGLAIGDIDGDGKPDIVLTNRGTPPNTIYIYLNQSTTGTINASSFAAPVSYTTPLVPTCVRLVDIDGDGKLDIMESNAANGNISVFRNLSTPGNISFGTRLDFPTNGNEPFFCAFGDIDGDGKPDMVTADYLDNQLIVFRNTSTPGNISFAGEVQFSTGNGPQDVAIADIDGDGKADIVCANGGDNTVSVFMNLSTSGNILLAGRVNFGTGLTPSQLAIGDIDGDGKPDILVGNTGSVYTISILRNTSTPGSITLGSFAGKVDFPIGNTNQPSIIALGDLNGDGKPDIVVADEGGIGYFTIFINQSSPGSLTTSSLTNAITHASNSINPHRVVLCDLDGDGRPEIVFTSWGSNYFSVYKNIFSCALLFNHIPL